MLTELGKTFLLNLRGKCKVDDGYLLVKELYTNKVQETCSEALSASNIRHPPITSRIKSWESAKESIARRNQERILGGRLREVVEARGRM